MGADIGATGTVDGTLDSMLGILGTLGVGAAPGTSRSNRSVCSGRSWDINTSCGLATTIHFQHNTAAEFLAELWLPPLKKAKAEPPPLQTS